MEKLDGGKTIYTDAQEILDPSHTALVVWDVQNMLLNLIFNKDEFMNKLDLVINLARKCRVPVFFCRMQFLPLRYDSPARIYTRKYIYSKLAKFPTKITPDDLTLAVKPNEDEVIVNKHTASIFIGTDFELMVRNAGLSTLVFTGIATELGVESCARDALNRDFHSVVVSDAVSSFHQESHYRSIETMKRMLTIISVKELESIWTIR